MKVKSLFWAIAVFAAGGLLAADSFTAQAEASPALQSSNSASAAGEAATTRTAIVTAPQL